MTDLDGYSILWGQLCRHLRARAGIPAGLGWRLSDLASHYHERGLGLDAILAATDRELLQAPGFGPWSLRLFRASVPSPDGRPARDDWREHADMLAGVPA